MTKSTKHVLRWSYSISESGRSMMGRSGNTDTRAQAIAEVCRGVRDALGAGAQIAGASIEPYCQTCATIRYECRVERDAKDSL